MTFEMTFKIDGGIRPHIIAYPISDSSNMGAPYYPLFQCWLVHYDFFVYKRIHRVVLECHVGFKHLRNLKIKKAPQMNFAFKIN